MMNVRDINELVSAADRLALKSSRLRCGNVLIYSNAETTLIDML